VRHRAASPAWAHRRPVGRAEYLRRHKEFSLRRLGLERVDLYRLHRIDPKVPQAEQLGELVLLQQEGTNVRSYRDSL
jgi:aryl-alcohol dehydrogenase-like predicted oxidoreductase